METKDARALRECPKIFCDPFCVCVGGGGGGGGEALRWDVTNPRNDFNTMKSYWLSLWTRKVLQISQTW